MCACMVRGLHPNGSPIHSGCIHLDQVGGLFVISVTQDWSGQCSGGVRHCDNTITGWCTGLTVASRFLWKIATSTCHQLWFQRFGAASVSFWIWVKKKKQWRRAQAATFLVICTIKVCKVHIFSLPFVTTVYILERKKTSTITSNDLDIFLCIFHPICSSGYVFILQADDDTGTRSQHAIHARQPVWKRGGGEERKKIEIESWQTSSP